MVEYWNLTLFIAGILSICSSVFFVLVMRAIHRHDNHLKLVMKTLYLNTKGIKTIGGKTDVLIVEQQKSFDNQRKSFDHHRVLVNSLTRQLKHIEAALFNGGHIDPSGGNHGDIQSVSTNNAAPQGGVEQLFSQSPEQRQNARKQAGNIAREKGVILLKSLFEEKEARSSIVSGNQQKAAELSTIFSNQVTARNSEMNNNTRRVSNG